VRVARPIQREPMADKPVAEIDTLTMLGGALGKSVEGFIEAGRWLAGS
jgi:hypothetical protein